MQFLPLPRIVQQLLSQRNADSQRKHVAESPSESITVPRAPASPVPTPSTLPEGPGTEFKKLLEQDLSISLPGCSFCWRTLTKMNELGVEGCRRHRDLLLLELRQNSRAVPVWQKLRSLPKAVQSGLAYHVNWMDPLPDLLDLAISRAEQRKVESASSQAESSDREAPDAESQSGSDESRQTESVVERPSV